MDELFHHRLSNGCYYLSLLGLTLIHVNKRDPCSRAPVLRSTFWQIGDHCLRNINGNHILRNTKRWNSVGLIQISIWWSLQTFALEKTTLLLSTQRASNTSNVFLYCQLKQSAEHTVKWFETQWPSRDVAVMLSKVASGLHSPCDKWRDLRTPPPVRYHERPLISNHVFDTESKLRVYSGHYCVHITLQDTTTSMI